jgi:hypothetical protein
MVSKDFTAEKAVKDDDRSITEIILTTSGNNDRQRSRIVRSMENAGLCASQVFSLNSQTTSPLCAVTTPCLNMRKFCIIGCITFP